jgi:YjbR protein
MNIADFRRIALSLAGAEESSHMGSPDFRVGNRIFATLAHAKLGYGNLMLDPEQQAAFVRELPAVFLPVHGGWGRNGATHIILANADEAILTGALLAAYKLRLAKNAHTKASSAKPRPVGPAAAKPSSVRRPRATKRRKPPVSG